MAKKDESRRSSGRKTESGKQKAGSGSRAPKAPTPDPDAEFIAADDPAAELLETAVRSTPWWAISIAFHGLALACLPLFIIGTHFIAGAESPTLITRIQPARVAAPIQDSDLKRTPMAHAGDPVKRDEDPADEKVPFIIDPKSEISDRIESDNNDDHRERKGQSYDGTCATDGIDLGLDGRRPGEGKGTNVSMGVGGGSGSGLSYGGPWGGRKNSIKRRQTRPTATDSAVEKGLRWLTRHQSADGGWHAGSFHAECKGTACAGEGLSDFDTGLTGLSLLSFLGAGYTSQNGFRYVDPVTGKTLNYGDAVRKGLDWLLKHQNADGCIGPQVGEMMYNHSIATLALTEACGLTNAVTYRAAAQKAVNFMSSAQNAYLGWRYTPRSGQNDTSVTGWCVMALKSAQLSNLEVATTSFDGARAWLNRVTDPNGVVGYDRLGSGEIYVPGKNEAWAHHPSMTAVGILSRIFIDKKKDATLALSAKHLMNDLPKWDPKAQRPSVDYYYWYYATLALYQLDGPTGASWVRWNKCVSDVLCANQKLRKDGCSDGSWDVDGVDRWAYAGGRVYGTAINVLTLEASYRYESVFGASDKRGK